MSLTGHILPMLAVLLGWFASTGMVAWLANRGRHTFSGSIVVSGIAAIAALVVLVVAAQHPTIGSAYASFFAAITIWGWLELSFLTGAVTGPRRAPSEPDSRGLKRFLHASSTLIHHELTLAAAAIIILSLSWNAINPTGAMAFTLLFGLRLSAKLNLFFGVPNMSDDLMPGHLQYLKSYFGPRRWHGALALSLILLAGLVVWLGSRALAAPADSFAAASASLVFGLAALGALEHFFLALPFRDGALWRWAIPDRPAASVFERESGYGL